MKKAYKLFVLYKISSSFIFTKAVFLLFLSQVKGLTLSQIALYQAISMITDSLFELPTGAAGDRYGKTTSLIIGNVILCIQTLLLFIIPTHMTLLIFLLAGFEAIGFTFLSGTDEAFLFELLEKDKKEKDYLRINAGCSSISSVAMGIATFLGGVFSVFSWQLVYLLTIFTFFVSLFVALRLRSYEKILLKMHFGWSDTGSYSFTNLKNVISYKRITLFLLTVCVLSSLDGLFNTYFNLNQIILQDSHINNSIIGSFFSALYFIGALAYPLAAKLNKKIKSANLIILLLIILSLFYLLLRLSSGSLVTLLLSAFICFVPQVIHTISDNFIQMNIKSGNRITLLSAISLVTSFFSGIYYLIFGELIGLGGKNLLLVAMSLYLIFVGVFGILAKKILWKRNNSVE